MRTSKYLVIILLLCRIGYFAQTNVYHPFPNDTAYWGIATSNASCSNTVCPYERIFQMGDTVVNSMQYKKVYSQWGWFGPPSNCGGQGTSCYSPYASLTLRCFLRQDSAAKKVYVAIPPGNHDTLLYDFNLNMGDTLPKTYAYSGWLYPNGSRVIQKIDSVLINGHYNKAFIVDPAHTGECSYLVEGVGSSTDLLSMGCGLGSYQWVDCFDSNPVQFGANGFLCVGYAVAGIKNEPLARQFKISPNPSGGLIEVELPQNASCVRVFDLVGKEIKIQKVNAEKVEVNLADYENGIYFVEVKTTGGIITQKLILNR